MARKAPKSDALSLDQKTLVELRKRAVSSVQKGQSPERIAQAMGVTRAVIYNWLALYRRGGRDALDAKKRGGRKRKLDGKKIEWLYDTITSRNPVQLRFTLALWTSKIVSELIEWQIGIRYSKASVCRLLNQLGLSPQRPLWHAYQKSGKPIRQWLGKEYPAIQRRAREERPVSVPIIMRARPGPIKGKLP